MVVQGFTFSNFELNVVMVLCYTDTFGLMRNVLNISTLVDDTATSFKEEKYVEVFVFRIRPMLQHSVSVLDVFRPKYFSDDPGSIQKRLYL